MAKSREKSSRPKRFVEPSKEMHSRSNVPHSRSPVWLRPHQFRHLYRFALLLNTVINVIESSLRPVYCWAVNDGRIDEMMREGLG
jgi:hypothetical protein